MRKSAVAVLSGVALIAAMSLAAAQPGPEPGQEDFPEGPPEDAMPPVETLPPPPYEGRPPQPPQTTAPPLPQEPAAPVIDAPAAPSKPSVAPVVVGVVLGGLDKIAARTARFEADINQQVFYNTLIVTARVCKTRPPEEPPESAAYVDIQERKPDGTVANVFSGWMFASSPALNALEHPVYDVWVISCKTVPPDTAAPAPPNS